MIIIESRTKGIKFERHKEESLISSQFLKNQKKSKVEALLIAKMTKMHYECPKYPKTLENN